MDLKTVIVLVATFLDYPLDEVNVLDWDWNGERVRVKLEDNEGMIEIHEFVMNRLGYAKTIASDGNFEVYII